MAKSSAVPQDGVPRVKQREDSPATVREQTREAVSPDLDRLIHERIRLGIVSALAVNRSLTFNELKALLKTTDGNLSVHARKLEEASYIAANPSMAGCPRRNTGWLGPGVKRWNVISITWKH
jgi:DNA-binding transcriptional ArsR family regulator